MAVDSVSVVCVVEVVSSVKTSLTVTKAVVTSPAKPVVLAEDVADAGQPLGEKSE